MSLDSTSLMDIWFAERPSEAASDDERARAQASLQEILERARRRWSELQVPAVAFVTFIGERFAPRDTEALALAEQHAGDLYLACACALGDREAIAELERLHRGDFERALRSFAADGCSTDDVRQRVLERVCFAVDDKPARIGSYAGRGPLGAWLRAAAVREALMMLRERRREAGSQPLERAAETMDPELALLKARYGHAFREAFGAACAALSARDRTLLRFKYSDGASIDAIAAVYRVHRATAARWLARIRDILFEDTRQRMMSATGLSDSEFDSVIRLIESQLDVSLSDRLES